MKRVVTISVILMMLAVLRKDGQAQYIAPPSDQREGSLSVSFQNYYNQINGRTVYNAQGGGVRLRRFYSHLGLLSAQFEPLISNGKVAFGDNYLSLTGVPWKGRHWDLYGGEFRAESSLVENPFANYQLPQLGLRGGRVIARTEKWTASAFAGQESLAQGSRVAFRKTVPQTVFGGTLAGQVRENIQLGFRVLQLNTSNDRSERTNSLFPLGRRVISSTSVTTQSSAKVTKKLRVYGEVSMNRSRMSEESSVKPASVSWVAGPAFDGDSLKVHANYLHQGFGYLPAAGYYLGDRKGPSVDGSYHIGRIGFSGNWLQSSNNIEHDTRTTDYFSRQGGGNIYSYLPLGFSVSGSLNQIGLRANDPTNGLAHHRQRQYLVSISRPVYRHNLRLAWLRTDQQMFGTKQQISSWEIEDSFSWSGITASGAVRLQSITGDDTRDSYFTRSSLQWGRGKLSIYGNWEHGRDLANETIFSTAVSTTSVVGMAWAAPGGMAIRLEGFRTENNTLLNSENLFLLNTRGIVPDAVISRNNDWNLYLRISREMGWGSHMIDAGNGTNFSQAPLLGSISGYVRLHTLDGDLPAANVWVKADTGVSARTDSSGYFAFPEIFQGKRTLTLDQDRLPADFAPMDPTQLLVDVRADQTARAELNVSPLVYFEGMVKDQDGSPVPEGIILALQDGKLQTTTDQKGRFGFYSLPEGEYQVEVVSTALPDETPLSNPEPAKVSVRHATPVPSVEVRIVVERQGPKPVKELNLGAAAKPVKIAPSAKRAMTKGARPAEKSAAPNGLVMTNPAKKSGPERSGRRVLNSTSADARAARPSSLPEKSARGKNTDAGLVASNESSPAVTQSSSRRLLVKSIN